MKKYYNNNHKVVNSLSKDDSAGVTDVSETSIAGFIPADVPGKAWVGFLR